MVYVCRKEHFNAAHRLFNPKWSDEKNKEVFGICSNRYYHGHNFEFIVTVKGIPDTDTGMVVDMKKLGDLIKEEVINKLDHRNMNEEVDFLKGKIPTCEIVVMELWKILADKVALLGPGEGKLYSLKLYETNKNFVEYYGE
jgi:6-pyruvoyltetrahydropterin/6-carboxytetrahydropterin synthase